MIEEKKISYIKGVEDPNTFHFFFPLSPSILLIESLIFYFFIFNHFLAIHGTVVLPRIIHFFIYSVSVSH